MHIVRSRVLVLLQRVSVKTMRIIILIKYYHKIESLNPFPYRLNMNTHFKTWPYDVLTYGFDIILKICPRTMMEIFNFHHEMEKSRFQFIANVDDETI